MASEIMATTKSTSAAMLAACPGVTSKKATTGTAAMRATVMELGRFQKPRALLSVKERRPGGSGGRCQPVDGTGPRHHR